MEPAIHHVLVATDLGEASALDWNVPIAVAERFGATLTLLHVCPMPTSAYPGGISYRMGDLEREASMAFDQLVATVRRRFPPLRSAFRVGVPWEEIVAAIPELPADLVVVGTHRRGGLAHALLGSVAERVVRMSPVPVLAARCLTAVEPNGFLPG